MSFHPLQFCDEPNQGFHKFPRESVPVCPPLPTITLDFQWKIGLLKDGQILRNTQAGVLDNIATFNLTYSDIRVNGVSVTLPVTINAGDAVEVVGIPNNPTQSASATITGTAVDYSTANADLGTWVNYPATELQNALVNETYFCTGRWSLEGFTGTTNYDVGAYSLQSFTGKGRITFRAVGRECFYGISPVKSYPVSNIYFRHYYSCYVYSAGIDTYELGSGGGASVYGLTPGGIPLLDASMISIEVSDNAGGEIVYSHNGIPFRTVPRAYNPSDVWYVDLSGRYNGEIHSPVFIEQL